MLGVAIVPRQDFLAESLYVEHSEGVTVANPSDDSWVLLIEDGVELVREA